jgi:general secretion pathway protein G
VIGKCSTLRVSGPEKLRSRRSLANSAAGFTLLELMIVMFIIIILVTVALPQYQHYVQRARETVLHDDLSKMRSLIDQYAADKGKLPQSLDDLVAAGYMREVPVDPITGEKDWQLVTGDDPNSTKGEQGVLDIKSVSPETSSEGTPYAEW